METQNDNKVEDIFFTRVVKNYSLNSEILKIVDLINEQNISSKDKNKIFNKIFWKWIINKDDEINSFLSEIRSNRNLDYSLLYKLIFLLIEDIFDIDDKESLNFVMADLSEDLETEFIYLIWSILEYATKKLEEFFDENESIFETISDDYLDDKELDKILNKLDYLFEDLITWIKTSFNEIQKFKDKIKRWSDEKNLILNIK